MQFSVIKKVAFLIVAALFGVAVATAEETPASRITAFYGHLVDVMKSAKALGYAGRTEKLGPAIDEAFDIPAMTRFAVGPDWAKLPPADQTGLIASFRRMTIANYAHNFDGYSGEQFVVDPNIQVRGPDAVVETKIEPPSGAATKLTYRMRTNGGLWKIIDVYYNGSVSELTTRRAEFSAILKAQGANGLRAHIDGLAASLGQ